ncbi:phosphatidate cytidylyltransferase [Paracoccus marinus]|uniref:phosphatidate cytidylyltransferase n=1 Tax=Paracoccus marinus TaxID=288426 RepID=UPI00163D5A36|nr:phosphatidate cytidylyltransferase [Paracoccus marinus]GLS80471.1 phosphatidate cytidylyltransferase [Paracoccus marinus]
MAGRWADLTQRFGSGLMVAVVGVVVLVVGHLPLHVGAAVLIAGLMWELTRITASQRYSSPASRRSRLLALMSALIFLFVSFYPFEYAVLLVAVPVVIGWRGTNPAHRGKFVAFALSFFLACLSLLQVREDAGLAVALWIAVTAVQSDVLGYFVGKALGGPKFWPAISPNKTWSGTLAGWIGAVVLAVLFIAAGYGSWWMLPVAPLLAFAGQMGDIAESALKRRTGIKDSSDLIPGHGGVMDRFDALTAAFLVALVFAPLIPRLGS